MTAADLPSRELVDRIAVSGTVAGAFITDTAGQILLVKAISRDEWGFVGGWVDRGESPHQGCAREIKEEIGLDLPVGDLLVLDWLPDTGHVDAPLSFYLFDCGVIEDPDLIRLQEEEIAEYGLFPPEAAVARSGAFNRERIGLAMAARRSGKTVYQPFLRQE